MAKNEVEEVTHKAIQKGGVLAKLYFDMESENKDELQPLMADMINNRLLKTPGVIYCFGAVEEPLKGDKTYTTSAVVTTLVKDISTLVNLSFMFSPIGIEIMKPEHDYTIKINELQAILLSLSQVSVDYAKYILTKVMNKEDLEKIERQLKNREELGKRVISKDSSRQVS